MNVADFLVVVFLLTFFVAFVVYVERDISQLIREQKELDELWADHFPDTGAGSFLLTGVATTTGARTSPQDAA